MEPLRDSRHTIKVHEETARRLRLIAAITGERQFDVVRRLIDSELYRVQGHLVLQSQETP